MRQYKSGMRWCAWRWTDVDPCGHGEIYLRRLHLVQTPWFSIMLHWINRADPQADMHDHPVTFLSILLRGRYVEENAISHRQYVQWWNFKRATDKHRITSITEGGVLSLVFASRVKRGWGFHTSRGWIPWRQYAKENKC